MADLREQDDMSTLLAMLATLVRLLRPSKGLHAGPDDYLRTLREEARARRVTRTRRYAASPGPVHQTEPWYASVVLSPHRPLNDPRVALRSAPAGFVLWTHEESVHPPADIVRGYYRAHEARQRVREDRDRLGVAVLMDMAEISA
jgi:hypothetical protein